jgi:signal transduction histidine kinase/CheY-like chemotaxis protein
MLKHKPLVDDIESYAQDIVETVREPLLMLDTTLRVRSANRAFYQTFQVSPDETENRLIYELGNGQWDIPALRTLLEDVIPTSSVFNDFELEHTFPIIGRRIMLLNGRKLRAGSHDELLVLAMEDVTERRRSEADLKEIDTYAQNIVDTVREPLLILDTTLRVRSGNNAFYQTFQVSADETENRLIYELGNGQWDIPALRTLLEDVIPASSVFNDFELEHTFPIIGRRVMLLNGRKLRAGSHDELLVLAMEDVTERRRAEADLKAIETYAQNIVDTVREPLLILDTTLRVRSGNNAFYQTFQVSSEETENRLIYELGNGQWDIPALRTLLEDIIPASSVFNDFELEHDFPVIGRRVMLLNGRRLQAGHHGELLVLAMEDVTERRRAEADLKAIETYAQNIVDTVREPLLILDTTLRVRSGNNAFYQTFLVSSAETENRLIYELGNGQWDIPALRTLLEDIIPASSVFNDFELEHDFPEIGRRVMLLNGRRLQAGHHGELLVLAMEDVTERRRAEADLKEIDTYAQNIVDTVREPLLILDTTLRVRSGNNAFYQTFQVSADETENRLIYELGNGQWDIPALRTLLEDVIPASSVFNDFELEHTFPIIGRRIMLLNGRKLRAGSHDELLVLAMEDVTERRRAEADLKAIETYAQNIVDTVREPLLILDTTLRVRSGNNAFYQTFQVSSDETENRLIYELGNGQWDIPALRTLLEDIIPASSVFNDFELEHDFPVIGRRVMLLNGRRLQAGHHGELLVLAMEDVTERRRAEADLKAIETYAQNIVDTVREPLLILDTSLRVRSGNNAFYQTFHVSSEETEDRLIYELGNGQWDIPALRTLLEDIIPASSVFNDFELEHDFPDIGRRVMLLNGRRLQAGHHGELLVLAMEDVTERRRAEADLKAIETYAQNIVDTVREPLLILDTALRVRSGNNAFYQTFKVTAPETEDRLIYELGNGQWDIPDLRTLLEDIVPKSSVFNDFELEHDFPEIGRRVMLLNGRRLQAGHHGELLVLAMEDVTERRRAEEEVANAKEASETANKTKSLFLANMSHELRTPLNAILGYSEMLQEEAQERELDASFGADLEKISGAGKHLLALINDILDLSKIEAGKMDLFLETFDLNEMIDEVASTIRPLVERNENTLNIERSVDLGSMHADQMKVRQGLYNLLSNAVKFTQAGSITLDAGRQRMDGKEWIVFRVADTGIGLSPEQIVKLFQDFTQADPSTTRKFGGTGLGLALTRRFCQMMGGDVTLHSVPGEGSIFTIKLPSIVSDPALEAEASHAAALMAAGDGLGADGHALPDSARYVLVVDDDPTQRALMQRFLSSEGFHVRTASGGEEAIAMARQMRPVAITLDVMMPGMDGWSVLTALKADAQLRDVPVIMLTMVDDPARGFALGASDYATKPVDRQRLGAILRKYDCADRPCTVLLVEDDPATRALTRNILEKEGWTVSEAENGRIALECMKRERPSLILLDLMMPEMDGFEFADRVRRHPEWRTIPIVVVTAHDLTSEDRRRLNGYVETILRKSGDTRPQLLERVRELLDDCRAPRDVTLPKPAEKRAAVVA